MVVLGTAMNGEVPIKTEDARLATRLNSHFSSTQGQLTLQLEVRSG